MFRAVDLPQLRSELIDWYHTRSARLWWESINEEDGTHNRSGIGVRARRMAEMFFVSPDMMRLAMHASQTLPDFSLQREDLPADRGFLYTPEPFWNWTDPTDADPAVAVNGFAWALLPAGRLHDADGNPIQGMAVSFLLDRDLHFAANTGYTQAMREAGLRDFPRIHERATATVWEFGNPLADDLARGRHDGAATTPGLVMKSVWLLMQQPLTDDEPEPFNRGQRRRLQHQDIPPGPVRTITLRRKAAPGHAHDTASHREYHHQWVVKGHWRQQWYPSRDVHRPIWIAPQIRGPEGAPILGGGKVYTWTR